MPVAAGAVHFRRHGAARCPRVPGAGPGAPGMVVTMHHLHRLLVTAGALALAACVTNPTWGEEPARRDPLDFSGMASKASAPLRIQAWNHGRGDFDTIRNFTGGTTRWATSPDLFGWSKVGVTLSDTYWVPPGAGCETSGMANLRVQEQNSDGSWSDLATFDAAGEACLNERLAAGDHPVAAGNRCKLDDARVVLFAPPQCVRAVTADATPAVVTVRLSDGSRAWQATSAAGAADVTASGLSRTTALTATAMVRDRDGAVRRVDLVGDTVVVCRRTSDGTTAALPLAVTAAATQPVTAGALAQISLDASRTIDVNRLVTATCPAGTTFVRVDATLMATGVNSAGATATSRAIRFTL